MRLAVYYDLAPGGAANALALYLRHLAENHRVEVFHPPGSCPVASDSHPLSGIGPLPSPRLYYWNRVSHPRYFRTLERRERELAQHLASFDRVLVHSCRGRGAPALLSHMEGRAVFYVTEPLRLYREPRFPDGEPWWWWSLARGLYAPVSAGRNRADARHGAQAERLLANSTYTADRVAAVYGRPAEVVHPPVDPGYFQAPLGEGEGGYVLSPGAILPPKGHGRVVRAMAALPGPRPRLVLAGAPVQRRYADRLRRLAQRLGVDMELRGPLSPEAYLDCVRRARVVVVAAVREPLGLVSLEAQALGRPVVVVREGGLPETVQDSQGLVDPDPASLARGLAAALEASPAPDPKRREWVAARFAVSVCGAKLELALCR